MIADAIEKDVPVPTLHNRPVHSISVTAGRIIRGKDAGGVCGTRSAATQSVDNSLSFTGNNALDGSD
jgi:hypothetical protein